MSRRVWKWVSILQGYDAEIRHIPGKVNPADALTRQLHGEDVKYAGQVKKEDQDWLQSVQVSQTVTDEQIQKRLNDLYKSQDVQDQKERAIQNVLPEHQREQCTVLAVSESRVEINADMRQRMMAKIKAEDQYSKIIERLEDPTDVNQVQINDKSYRMK